MLNHHQQPTTTSQTSLVLKPLVVLVPVVCRLIMVHLLLILATVITRQQQAYSNQLIGNNMDFVVLDRSSIFEQNDPHSTKNYQLEFNNDPQSSLAAKANLHHHNNQQQHDIDYYNPEPQQATNNHMSQHEVISTFDTPLSNSFSHQPSPLFNRLPDKEYLSHDLAEKACRLDRGCQRKDRLNNTYLSYCSRYKLENLLSNEILMSIMHDSSEECDKILDEFIQLDELINQFDRLFKNLLTRYNCHNGYSVKWSCDDCKKAYKDWLCATNLPYYMNGERIKPCISFCERVEQRCPYLHPIVKEQYGGQPAFICRDPNIPFVPEITPDIPYSEPAKCYDLCHLSDNVTELITDSLSKYEFNKCPDKGSIAEEVRSDPLYCRLDLHQQSNRSKTPSHDQYDSGSITEFPGDDSILSANDGTLVGEHSKSAGGGRSISGLHVHNKKMQELREVLTIYKSQPKTHKFGHYSSEHTKIDTSKTKPRESQPDGWSSSSDH